MPTKEQMDWAMAEIERARFDSPKTAAVQYIRMQSHEWPGFSRDEQLMVVGRVLNIDPIVQWMNGLDKEMSLEEIEATSGWKRSMKLESYLDDAPEREIESWYEWIERQDAGDPVHGSAAGEILFEQVVHGAPSPDPEPENTSQERGWEHER